MTVLVVERPRDALQPSDLERGELGEGRGGEVEVPFGAAFAAVGDLDGDGFALVCGRDGRVVSDECKLGMEGREEEEEEEEERRETHSGR